MDVRRGPSKSRSAGISERLGLFVAPSLQSALKDESLPAPEADQVDYRSLVSRQIERGSSGLRKRLELEDAAAAAPPEYVADVFNWRGRRQGSAARRA